MSARIRRAEEDLFLSEAMELRAETRLRALQADPDADPAEVEARQQNLDEVRALMRTQRETLAKLRETDPAATGGFPQDEEADNDFAPQAEADPLEDEFLASLDQFDRLLHDHFEKTRAAMNRRIGAEDDPARSRANAAAEAADLLRQMGVDPGTDVTADEASPDRADDSGRTPAADVDTGGDTDAETSGAPGRRQPRDDEDIVARQLREAAESETDPVLRERLWKEYDAYLDGRD